MKISEFAEKTKVSVKMLRHYDEIGLLRPHSINKENGYRDYTEEQEKYVNWINIFKYLGFGLSDIKHILEMPVNSGYLLKLLKDKRIEIILGLNNEISRKLQIDQLISIIEEEGFIMERKIDLMQLSGEDIKSLLKKMPSVFELMEKVEKKIEESQETAICAIRTDISHFKSVNDQFGHDVGDKVIAACFEMFETCVSKLADTSEVARAGGDEFIAVIIGNGNRAHQIAEAYRNELARYDFEALGCVDMKIGCYIGITVSNVNETPLKNVLDQSVEAVNSARKLGVNRISIL